MAVVSGLTYIGWTFIGKSLVLFGVLHIENNATNKVDVYIYPLDRDPTFVAKDLPDPISIRTQTQSPPVAATSAYVTQHATDEATAPGLTTLEASTVELTTGQMPPTSGDTTSPQTTQEIRTLQPTTTTQNMTTGTTQEISIPPLTTTTQNKTRAEATTPRIPTENGIITEAVTTSAAATTAEVTTPEASTSKTTTELKAAEPTPILTNCFQNDRIFAPRPEIQFAPSCGEIPLKSHMKRTRMNEPVDHHARIIGGSMAKDGDWPWMASIYERESATKNKFICGASVISNQWVVSAAHCFQTLLAELYGVMLGEYSFSERSGHEVDRNISKIIPHPCYKSAFLDNDIALVKLSEAVEFGDYIQPICVVPPGTPTDNDTGPTYAGSGKSCSVLGWGRTSLKSASRSDVLMELNTDIMAAILCQHVTLKYVHSYLNGQVRKGSHKFCAGGATGEDTCNGDSGGPLLCKHDDDRYFLHGITSYGSTVCAQALHPGVYTKVADFAEWMYETIMKEG